MNTYFITGGAGFLGINLARHLLAKGERVAVYDIATFDYPEKDKVKVFVGDIRDRSVLEKALRDSGANVVVHTAAALPLYSPGDILSTDIDGTRNVLELAEKAGIKRFVHISSTAVYGIPDHHPLREDDALSGVGPYGIAKIEAEKLCVEARKRGMVVTIIRPKSFVGPERLGVFALFYDWAKDGHNFPMIGNGKNRYQFLDVEDLCEAIWLSATLSPDRVNDVFNIGAKEFTTMAEDYQSVLNEAGFGKKIIPFPAWPMIWALRFLEIFKLSPLYKWVYETAHKDSFVAIDKAQSKLGWSPKYSNKQALLRNYHWYIANLDKFSGQSGVSHRVPWKQGVLGLVKKVF
jgi:nucleoside-diphosphate-sugar epimerase